MRFLKQRTGRPDKILIISHRQYAIHARKVVLSRQHKVRLRTSCKGEIFQSPSYSILWPIQDVRQLLHTYTKKVPDPVIVILQKNHSCLSEGVMPLSLRPPKSLSRWWMKGVHSLLEDIDNSKADFW